jgi:NhaA family Na+:H+ antiporter
MSEQTRTREERKGIALALAEFLRLESAGGILLVIAAVVAIILANSPLHDLYRGFLTVPVTISIGQFGLSKPFLLWINDGFMAVFFLLVGLEIKREIMEGELASRDQVLLPAVAAFGGLAVPAALYVLINHDEGSALNGWAIPTATDIAFALGVLSLLGSRVPLALKVFLTAVAIIDDIAAILIIALFYSDDLSVQALMMGAIGLVTMIVMNRRGVTRIAPYALAGTFMWIFMVKSGVHATLAGVLTAFCIPLRCVDEHGHSPAKHLEHTLHPWVAFGILPLFAFANAGVSFEGLGARDLARTVPGQAGRRVPVRLADRKVRPGQASGRHLLDSDLRCGRAVRHRLYDESVHRLAGVRARGLRLRRPGATRRHRGLSAVGATRIYHTARVRPAECRGTGRLARSPPVTGP